MSRGTEGRFALLLRRAAEAGRPLILDGALGTQLDDRGADTGGPAWSGLSPLREARLLADIHAEYAAAGADLISTCTFRTTARALASAGLPEGTWRDAAIAAVEIARGAAEASGALVVGSLGPLEDCFRPDLAPEAALAEEEHLALAALLVESGVDALWLETFPSAAEAMAAARAAKRAGAETGIPFAASLVARADGALLSGEPLGETARALAELGAAAVGVNCVPSAFVGPALDALLAAGTGAPISVYANLGRAEEGQGWTGSAHLEPEAYAALARGWVERGARIVGSCCGSSPAHTRALSEAFGARG